MNKMLHARCKSCIPRPLVTSPARPESEHFMPMSLLQAACRGQTLRPSRSLLPQCRQDAAHPFSVILVPGTWPAVASLRPVQVSSRSVFDGDLFPDVVMEV